MLDRQLRTVIADYVAGRVDLDRLEETVVAKSWAAEHDGEWVAAAIADRVTFALAELDAGLITEEVVRERLTLLAPEWASWTIMPETGSMSSPSRAERWLAGAAVVGTARAVVSA